MSDMSPEEGKKVVFKGMILLGIITLIEVFIALIGNGHVIPGFHLHKLIMYPAMIGFSMYKAYFIVYEFMHMRYEVKSLAMSVILPTVLLIWATIAFLDEGSYWKDSRAQIELLNANGYVKVEVPMESHGDHQEVAPVGENSQMEGASDESKSNEAEKH
ncbi:cytochrome C oxidase subunit IV family protein [Candidatus Brachybacter algidus]|jgi:cytochrome c oxidase subunit IV|uniref:cytochrome C oxidase subunit IV family protein n=1 Tax=Candidatus Brachybacter algidus TaxID=2982024 RepID=UPI001DF0AA36|nr:cytochrome C oxidase subunit IV family protein [Candidatus Brachybacter algidus]MBK6372588.1 cytochrome C oxidase subunit IV family protein [Candidatus Brachybacter algidus]MBK6448435.1 cytochrome C oxidase subunit IV family protein [Candidatus Brachybacter algidus]HQW72091.1 cytochrome C oxidase subunit IV family protein [Saprospiraceae bacterium]